MITPPSECQIERIGYADAMRLIMANHYLHRKAPCSVAFGMIHGGIIKGVICYGTPSSAPLRKGLAGQNNASNIVELTRLWVCDSIGRNAESMLIGRTIKHCGKELVVSYADASQGHVGIVYQATNWLYTGLSAKRTNWTVSGINQHCQTLADKYTASEIREKYGDRFSLQPRPRKHRYVYINAKGRRKRELLEQIRYPILTYPKQ